jgi:hypothetical protein
VSTQYETEFAWAPAWSNGSPRPFILPYLTRNTRREACIAFGETWRRKGETPMQGWRRAYRRGARCIRVRIEPAFGTRPHGAKDG